jgi:hypothetical protein
MARRRELIDPQSEWLKLAGERVGVEMLGGWVRLKYQPDADLLSVKFKEQPRPTRSESDIELGVIYNYAGRELVSLEILDLYEVFVTN